MPVRIYNSADQVTFDSDNCVNGVCGGSFFVPAGASFVRQWPLLAGCTLRVAFHRRLELGNLASVEKGISYPGSVPTISLPPNEVDRYLTVWVVGTPTLQNIPGVQAQALNSGVAISPGARGMNYIGRAAFSHDDPNNLPYDGSGGGSHAGIKFYRIAWHEEPLFCVRLDDNRGISLTETRAVAPGLWEIGITVRALSTPPEEWRPWWPLPAEVYCFGRPSSPQSSPTFAVWAPDTSLAYDLARPGLLVARELCEYELPPGRVFPPVTVPVSRTPVMGIIGSPSFFYQEFVYWGDNQDGSIGQHEWHQGTAAWCWDSGGLALRYAWNSTQFVSRGSRDYAYEEFFLPSTAIVVDLTGL